MERECVVVCKIPISLAYFRSGKCHLYCSIYAGPIPNAQLWPTFIIIFRNATISTSVSLFVRWKYFCVWGDLHPHPEWDSLPLLVGQTKWTNNSSWIISTLHKFAMKFIGMPWIFIKKIKKNLSRNEYENRCVMLHRKPTHFRKYPSNKQISWSKYPLPKSPKSSQADGTSLLEQLGCFDFWGEQESISNRS